MNEVRPIIFEDHILKLIDQRKLPGEEYYVQNKTLEEGIESIAEMVVRGAPCIGFSAIYSLALWVKNQETFVLDDFIYASERLKCARPTAVNLAYEVDRVVSLVKRLLQEGENALEIIYQKIIDFGDQQLAASELKNRQMSQFVIDDLIQKYGDKKLRVITHCNTGHLACGSVGTALGVIQLLYEQDRLDKVYVDETRPYLQGSRLTAYELSKMGIPFEIVVDSAASFLMSSNLVDFAVTGADRVVANGDTANKIGTANLAIVCQFYKIPFYIVAPSSSFDFSIQSGADINIELRSELEVLELNGNKIAPEGSKAFNPSFDITPGSCITGISCEKGLACAPFIDSLPDLFKG